MVTSLSPLAPRPSPEGERCPDCGHPAPLRHKGRRLVRCAACNLARRRERHRAYDAAHRQQKQERRRQGGVPCPPYAAWTVEGGGPGGACMVYGDQDWRWPIAVALPAYGTCSCGEAGCVHLLVALLAQQGGGGD